MKIGVTFPQTEIGSDPAKIREFVTTAEGLGYTYMDIRDHVLGADHTVRPNWNPPLRRVPPYNHKDMFHEVFVLLGYVAGMTKKMQLMTQILVLPQRQTALVAKQAAEVDVLSNGRLILGVAAGWNDVEFEALNENYKNRGSRLEEQIEVLRLLWTQEVVTFKGKYHTITAAGINPMPVQRPIPIIVGAGDAEKGWRRAARIGDGFAGGGAAVRQYAQEAGRDLSKLIFTGAVGPIADLDACVKRADAQKAMGTTHCVVSTLDYGLTSFSQHIDTITQFAKKAKHLMAS